MIKTSILILTVAFTASGCAVGPDYARPDTPTKTWVEAEASDAINLTWWEVFKDPTLNDLIVQVSTDNLDIATAQARVVEARALRSVAHAPLLPSLGAGGGFSRSQQSLNDPQFIQGPPGSGINAPRIQNRYEAGFDAAWEIDVFGGNRRALEAAGARVESAEAFRRDIVLSVIAETARNYIELRGNQKRIALLQRNVDLQKQTVDLVKSSFKSGLSREVDVTRAEAQLATTQALIPNLEAEVRATAYRLSVLTGEEPGALFSILETSTPLPAPDEVVSLGLKSDLLRRRPDIQIAERDLAAATADVGVAVAELYPSFNLTGAFGTLSDDLGDLLENSSETFLFSPFIDFPIFEGGRLRAQINAAEARNSQAAIIYEQTILNALEEAESALIRYAKEQETRARLKKAVIASAHSAELSNTLYVKGLTDFIDVLDAERALTASEDSLVQSETRVLTNLVALYKALGGGWEIYEENLPQYANREHW